jgi:hypothetical protein
MGMDWTALANTVSGIGQGLSQPNSTTQNLNLKMNQMFQAQAQQQALQRAEEERKKKEKSGSLGKVGAALGTIGGIALAPLTGGASLAIPAALGAAGGAIGGSVGRAVGGGGFDMQQTLTDAAMGGVGGLGAGVLGGFGKAGQTAFNAAGNVGPAVAPTPMGMAKAGMTSLMNPVGAMTGMAKKPGLIRLPDGTLQYADDASQYGNTGY